MKVLLIFFALLPACALAQVDSQFGLGIGTQYGGALGLKYSLNLDSDKLYIGAGRADLFDEEERYGVTLGWENLLNDHHALGIAVRTRTKPDRHGNYVINDNGQPEVIGVKDGYETFVAGTYTYYFDSPKDADFLTGVSVGKEYRHDNVVSEFRSGVNYGVFFGYQF